MSQKNKLTYILITCICLVAVKVSGQEYRGPLRYKAELANAGKTANWAKKTTALSIPFFEDFTGPSMFPDPNKWQDNEVYINNTMCVMPVSRGVATFDGLNSLGMPYDPVNNGDFLYSDSLTSQPIDLSGLTAADSVYMSFFYQPQGNGYYPLTGDSLMLLMKTRYGGWVTIWKIPGTGFQPFTQVMLPISDSLYLHSAFQFRFINIAAMQFADADWNVDYIRLDKNRSMYDTAVSDIAYSANPSFLLNDYTSMPYRQFLPFAATETATQFIDSIHNNYSTNQSITYWYEAKDLGSGTVLQAPASGSATLGASSIQSITCPTYSATVPMGGIYDKVVFEDKYSITPNASTGSIPNDTVVRHQTFDNYLAYDDGSAEQSYFLNLFPTLPGKIAIEYHLNIPDTLKGMAIYFGRQDPPPTYKMFSIVVYSSIQGMLGAVADNVLYQQDLCYPGYMDTLNNFWIYKFDQDVPLPAGTFYAGTIQPAASGSDSLYFGLDINRLGGNHAYYNVLDIWNPSLINGAIMMHPLLGKSVTSSSVRSVAIERLSVGIVPNPAKDRMRLSFEGDRKAKYSIMNIQGQTIMTGSAANQEEINIANIAPGMYLVNINYDGVNCTPQKLIKL